MASEDENVKKLVEQLESGKKYKVLTQQEYEALLAVNTNKSDGQNQGATGGGIETPRPVSTPLPGQSRFGFPFPGFSPVPRINPFKFSDTSYMAPPYSQPKLPIFSGQDVPPKGEVTYEVWSFEVKCLQNSHTLPDHVLLQAIRNSLKGSARTILVPLGESATVADILNKLDGFYGNVSSAETLMQNFYSDFQKDKESIVEYGSRLEQTLARAIRYGHIDLSAKDAMLRTKFWTGLNSQQLKNSTRHLFDSIKDFQLLLREIRKVEQEDASGSRLASKQKTAQQHSSQASNEPDTAQLLKQMNVLMEKMQVMEKKLDSQQQQLSARQPSSPDSSYQQPYQQPQYSTSRSRSVGRGFGRGYNRGARSRGYGRGFQNTEGSQYQYNRDGSSQGGNRGGASGRGASRGGNFRGSQSLN